LTTKTLAEMSAANGRRRRSSVAEFLEAVEKREQKNGPEELAAIGASGVPSKAPQGESMVRH
jgi:hypothetical protein